MGYSPQTPFSEYSNEVRLLKLKDRHFSRLYEELLQINEQIEMIEQPMFEQPMQNADKKIDDLKIRRLYLTEKLHEKIINKLS